MSHQYGSGSNKLSKMEHTDLQRLEPRGTLADQDLQRFDEPGWDGFVSIERFHEGLNVVRFQR